MATTLTERPPSNGKHLQWVIKRSGERVPLRLDEITARLEVLSEDLDDNVFPSEVTKHVANGVVNDMTTEEIDLFAAKTAGHLAKQHPDYAVLGGRILANNLQKNTRAWSRIEQTAKRLLDNVSVEKGLVRPAPLIAQSIYDFMCENKDALNAAMQPKRDYRYNYFAMSTYLNGGYLQRAGNGEVIETPQHAHMRIACGLWRGNLEMALRTYEHLSLGEYTHATPTMFNAGTVTPQCSSCFAPGTLVHTLDGIKPIQDIIVGDRVVTHSGAVRTVQQLHTNPLGDRTLFALKIMGTPEILVTNNHKLWSISMEQMNWVGRQGEKHLTWNEVGYLRVGDYVAIPKKLGGLSVFNWDIAPLLDEIRGDGDRISYTYVTPTQIRPASEYSISRVNHGHAETVDFVKPHKPFNRIWKIDAKAMEWLGMWYGDGCVSHATNSQGNRFVNHVNIVQDYKNQELIDFVVKTGEAVFGHSVKPSVDKHGQTKLGIYSRVIANIFKNQFGSGFDKKKLPSWINEMDYECIRHFLAGLVSTDGCVSKDGVVVVQLSNPELMQEIFALARSVGIPVTLTIMHQKKGSPTGRMNIPAFVVAGLVKKYYNDTRVDSMETEEDSETSSHKYITVDNTICLRITGKQPSTEQHPVVYTLGVDTDHSYSVGGIMASNCYLLSMFDDSLDSIYDTVKACAMISKRSGGIGVSISNIRAAGTHIVGTGGKSKGLVPMLRVLNSTAKYADQGGKRPGAFAVYLEPWHADILGFLDLRKQTGIEDLRCRDLFLALWIPDLFMRRVEADGNWSLFSPHQVPQLHQTYGREFDRIYEEAERNGLALQTVRARDIWSAILVSQEETGTPYMCFKDACNIRSNQRNIRTIRCSNLCGEITQVSDENDISVCNLASVCLDKFVVIERDETGAVVRRWFDHQKLYEVSYDATLSLNRVIDINSYPDEKAKRTNQRDRPIGWGVQGLANAFILMRYPFNSPEAAQLNADIAETMDYAATCASRDLAKIHGPYETFPGSPISEGKKQWHLAYELAVYRWENLTEKERSRTTIPKLEDFTPKSGRWDWQPLLDNVKVVGVRNSLLLANMPTATTASFFDNVEGAEAPSSFFYVRETLAGNFTYVMRELVQELIRLGLWNDTIRAKLIKNKGSIADITEIPRETRDLFQTSYDLSGKVLIDMSMRRGWHIDQSESFNVHMKKVNTGTLTSSHFYAWRAGVKTGMYYLRRYGASKSNAVDTAKVVSKEEREKNFEESQMTQRIKEVQEIAAASKLRINELHEIAAAAHPPEKSPDELEAELIECSLEAMRSGVQCGGCQ